MESFILSHVMELRNEVVLGNIWEQCLDFDGSRIGRTTVKKAVFPLVGRSGSFRKMSAKRKQKIGAICLSQSHVNSLGNGEGDDAVAGTNVEISKGVVMAGGSSEGDEVRKDHDKDEFGPLLKFNEVVKEMDARGATLPSDMIEAAKSVGIRKLPLHSYFYLQGSSRLSNGIMLHVP